MAQELAIEELGQVQAVMDADLRIVDVSDKLALLLGYSVEEMLGQSGWLFVRADQQRRRRLVEQLNGSGSLDEVATLVARDGQQFEYRYKARRLANGNVVVSGIVLDDEMRRLFDQWDYELVEDLLPEFDWRAARLEPAIPEQLAARPAAHSQELAANRWISKAEAAEYAHVSERTLERAVAAGELEAGGTRGRRLFQRVALDAWLAGGSALALLLALVTVLLAFMLVACACGSSSACELMRELGRAAPGYHG